MVPWVLDFQDSTPSQGGNPRFHGCDVANFKCFFQGIWGETCMETWAKEREESQVMVKVRVNP